MYPSVRAAFWKFSGDREGVLNYMYVDNKNLVTTGTGNLIDAGPQFSTAVSAAYMAPALPLEWLRSDGSEATQQEIANDWTTVKTARASGTGGGNQKGIGKLHLSLASMDKLKEGQLSYNESQLRKYFPDFDSFPADAQLGLHSMAWAAGPHFSLKFPKFTKAVNSGDFQTASVECHMSDLNADRQDANTALFQNAASVLSSGAEKAILYWPGSVGNAVRIAAKTGVGIYGTGIAFGLGYAVYRWLKG